VDTHFPDLKALLVFHFSPIILMKSRVLLAFALGCGLGTLAPGASITWTTSPGLADTEVSTVGTGVLAYYFSSGAARPATVPVNGVNFTLSNAPTAPAGLAFNNGSFNNPEDVDCYQVPLTDANQGLNAILDGQNWGGASSVDMTGLSIGQQYQVQYFLSDDRAAFLNKRHYAISDGDDPFGARDLEYGFESTRGGGVPAGAPAGSVDAKIYTGVFTADATTQGIYTWLYENFPHDGASANSGSQINAIQLRIIPEPTTAVLSAACLGLLLVRRRR
jgi:hypothetical protein